MAVIEAVDEYDCVKKVIGDIVDMERVIRFAGVRECFADESKKRLMELV